MTPRTNLMEKSFKRISFSFARHFQNGKAQPCRTSGSKVMDSSGFIQELVQISTELERFLLMSTFQCENFTAIITIHNDRYFIKKHFYN